MQQQQMQAARAQQQAQQPAAAGVTKPNADSSPKSCGLTKEYINGTVKFRDTCTGEWAERDPVNSKQ
jgi:membrane protease subunit (stomatin/prohibitin family)